MVPFPIFEIITQIDVCDFMQKKKKKMFVISCKKKKKKKKKQVVVQYHIILSIDISFSFFILLVLLHYILGWMGFFFLRS